MCGPAAVRAGRGRAWIGWGRPWTRREPGLDRLEAGGGRARVARPRPRTRGRQPGGRGPAAAPSGQQTSVLPPMSTSPGAGAGPPGGGRRSRSPLGAVSCGPAACRRAAPGRAGDRPPRSVTVRAEGRRRARGTPVPTRHLGRPSRRTCDRRVRRPVPSFSRGVSLRCRPARPVRAGPSAGRACGRELAEQDRETPPHARRGELRSPSGERLRKSRRRPCPTATARTGASAVTVADRGRPAGTAASRRQPRRTDQRTENAARRSPRGRDQGVIRPGRAPALPGPRSPAQRAPQVPRSPAHEGRGDPSGSSWRRRASRAEGGGKSGVSPWTAFVLTEVREVGTLRPCAWGVPWLACVPSNRKASRNRPPQSAPFPPRGGNLQHSTHPTAWVGDVPG